MNLKMYYRKPNGSLGRIDVSDVTNHAHAMQEIVDMFIDTGAEFPQGTFLGIVC